MRVVPDVAPQVVARHLRRTLPPDVRVLTRGELEELEIRYWTEATATGIIFGTGTIVAFLVGAVVFYQVLASDILNHLSEYATLKALGYKNLDISLVVLQQALFLAVMAFVPALLLSLWVYGAVRQAAYIPVNMSPMRIVLVFGLAVLMGSVSSWVALGKVKHADPAELF